MRSRAVLAAGTMAAVAALGALGAAPAVAHQSPANCSTNGLDLTVSKSRTLVRNGDQMAYTVLISNNKAGSCDLTGLGVTLTLPAANGTATGQSVTVASNVSLPAGSTDTVIGTVPYTVALNPGLSNAVVKAEAAGILHDAPTDNTARIEKTLGTTVTQPHLTLTETVTPTTGESPTTATFTYTVTNDSTTPSPIRNVVLTTDERARAPSTRAATPTATACSTSASRGPTPARPRSPRRARSPARRPSPARAPSTNGTWQRARQRHGDGLGAPLALGARAPGAPSSRRSPGGPGRSRTCRPSPTCSARTSSRPTRPRPSARRAASPPRSACACGPVSGRGSACGCARTARPSSGPWCGSSGRATASAR